MTEKLAPIGPTYRHAADYVCRSSETIMFIVGTGMPVSCSRTKGPCGRRADRMISTRDERTGTLIARGTGSAAVMFSGWHR